MEFKKITFLAYLLITSHIFAWQPSGWVYQMGDYQYEYESGDWYWKSNWDYWHVGVSTGDWTTSSFNGWNYYTYPYFYATSIYSTSIGQWRFAADPESEADVVNLRTGNWSKFGQFAETGFAPVTLGGTFVETNEKIHYFGDSHLDSQLNYFNFDKDLETCSVGSYTYKKTGPNIGHTTINASNRDVPEYEQDLDFTFTGENALNISNGIGAAKLTYGGYDIIPNSLAGLTLMASGQTRLRTVRKDPIPNAFADGESRTIIFTTSNTGVYSAYQPYFLEYSLFKNNPSFAKIRGEARPNSEVIGAAIKVEYSLFFVSNSSGYYMFSENQNYSEPRQGLDGWGSFSIVEH